MKRLYFIFALLTLSVTALPLHAQNVALQGFCSTGGTKVVTQGINSTTMVQASYPKCLVTVYLTGTQTKATIYSNSTGTLLANPFTAGTNAAWIFYAASGIGYDVVLQGGTPNPFPAPFTLTDVMVGGSGSGGSGTVLSGAQYLLPNYTTNPTGTVVGPGFNDPNYGPLRTDATGALEVPGASMFFGGSTVFGGLDVNDDNARAVHGHFHMNGIGDFQVNGSTATFNGNGAFTVNNTAIDLNSPVVIASSGNLTNNGPTNLVDLLEFAGNAGTAGQVVTSGGTLSAPSWKPIALPNSGVNAGSYGGPASAPVFTVSATGILTSASSSPITPTGIGAAKAPIYSIAPVVDYQFQEDGGTVVHDFSGNNYNATLGTGGRAPTWIPNGLTFPTGTGVDMPTQAAINSAMTWCWVGNFTPLAQNAINTTNYEPLMSSNDGGTNGVTYNVAYTGTLVGGQYGKVGGLASFGTFINNAGVTSINAAYAGVQRVCIVRGLTSNSTVDHVYLNGAEVDSYQSQGKSGDTTNATFYTLGAQATGTWMGGLFGSTLYRTTAWTGQLTPSQIQQADQVQQYDLLTRGISYTPTYATHSLPQLVNMGDSITFCQGVTSGLCWNLSANLQPKLTNQPTYIETNFGITSVNAFAIGNAEPGRGTNFCQTAQGPGVLTLWEGTNDIANFATMSIQTLVDNIAGAVQKYKLAGCRVYVMTTISRCGNAGQVGCSATGTFEAARASLNQSLLQQAKTIGANGVIDIASLPYLGSTNAYNAGAGGGTCPGATTYFQADCVHPTNTAQPFISTVVANSLNYYSGTTLASPYVVTATATLPSSARVTDASGCTSACTLTLPDGTGPSGETYTIITGPTNVVSVQGQTLYGIAQTVNGSSSAVALPTNSTVHLKIVPLPQATAGVKWVM